MSNVEKIGCTFDRHLPNSKQTVGMKDARLIYVGRKYCGTIGTTQDRMGANRLIVMREVKP